LNGLTSFRFCRMSAMEPFGFFEEPVTEELAPGYGKVVSQPMCFRVRAAPAVSVHQGVLLCMMELEGHGDVLAVAFCIYPGVRVKLRQSRAGDLLRQLRPST